MFLEVIRTLYLSRADAIIVGIQGCRDRVPERKVFELAKRIADFADERDFQEVMLLFG